ncbi:MaoC family dehydratase [Nocardioides panzhihuensis]|uniref:Acyl dehydratase n=1 Tax=Nocardioides panzhihuensis TaxID=860243 RepID=A0A7Z0DP65_9ACTN|nr:MaoC family dehydratase [Nocardioides panzhihuensis]NYI78867.1 acyl dehydratase [Nocardioides panzhihuensis]
MRTFTSITAIEAVVGEDLGTTDWVPITQDRVDRFAEITGDHQWIHVDVERAAASSFGGTIAHGYLTLSMLPAFAAELYTIDTGSARLNYGLEKARFPAPLRVGSKIRATPRIKEVRTVEAGTQLLVAWTVEAEGAERPVCVAETITLILP